MPRRSRTININVATRVLIDNLTLFLNIMIPTILRIKKKTVEIQKIVFMLGFCFINSPPFHVYYTIFFEKCKVSFVGATIGRPLIALG